VYISYDNFVVINLTIQYPAYLSSWQLQL